MDFRQSIFFFVNIAIATISTYFILRGARGTMASRAPLLIVCSLLFFSVGLESLPVAFPATFEHVLGHSVWANYTPPLKLNVTQVGGTWWVIRWRDPIQAVYRWVFLAGIIWAIVNIVQRRGRKLNVFRLCFGVVLALASFMLSFICFPFCV